MPPGDHRGDVQVFGLHQEGDLGDRPMHVQLARPPALLGEIRQALELDLDLHGCLLAGRELAAGPGILRPAFDLVGIVARGDVQPGGTGASEVVAPEGQGGRPLRFTGRVAQVDAARDRLARLPVEHRELDRAGTVLGFGRVPGKGDGQQEQAGENTEHPTHCGPPLGRATRFGSSPSAPRGLPFRPAGRRWVGPGGRGAGCRGRCRGRGRSWRRRRRGCSRGSSGRPLACRSRR